ncbi:MAG TPA: S16 family serine protease, partial [Micromonosporaceae bacterium]
LLDRMELVALDGYTEDEKVAIARDHLWPRQLERAGLGHTVEAAASGSAAAGSDDAAAEPANADAGIAISDDAKIVADVDVTISDDALRRVAAEYTREAGVRQLERALARVLRKVAVKLADGPTAVHIGADDLVPYLGRPRFEFESAERTAVPGVATGLAVTGAGGDVLFIEATSMEGEGGLTLTGQLGDVMKESAQIALSYLRSHGAEQGIDVGTFTGRRLHVHVPAGAVPKDGPSAGITMVTALASLASGRPVRPEVGMTGEVTLSGRVLPIGGVKQKLLAAHRAGLTEVIIPARNEPDLDDLPEEIRAELTVHPVRDVADVLRLALRPAGVQTDVAQDAVEESIEHFAEGRAPLAPAA